MASTPVILDAPPPAAMPISKTAATWAAALFGTIGIHRLYVYGKRDLLAWLLIPLLGLMITAAMLTAIVWGLRSDDVWNARHNPGRDMPPSGWGNIFGVIFALVIGAAVLMATLAFTGQRWFEYQAARESSVR